MTGVLLCAVGAIARKQLSLDFQQASSTDASPPHSSSRDTDGSNGPQQQPAAASTPKKVIQKEYLALITGWPAEDEGSVQVKF